MWAGEDMHLDRDRPYLFKNGDNEYESTIKSGDHVQVDATNQIGRCSGFRHIDDILFIRVKFSDGTVELFERTALRKISPSEIQSFSNNPYVINIMENSVDIKRK